LLFGLMRDRSRVLERIEALRTLDLSLDRIDAAFATVAVRAGSGAGLVTTDSSITVHAAWERPGVPTDVPGRHKVHLEGKGAGIVLRGAIGTGLEVPGPGTLRVRVRHEGAWHDAFNALETGALPDMIVVDAWLQDDPTEDMPPDRRRVLVVVDSLGGAT
jgi:hypothetical protein